MSGQIFGLIFFVLIIMNFAGLSRFGTRTVVNFAKNERLNKDIGIKIGGFGGNYIGAYLKFYSKLLFAPSDLYKDDLQMKKEINQLQFVIYFFIFTIIYGIIWAIVY